ncbi:hypothetical protein [Mycolicibacter icosiumassiliensis]|uniref:hypothetical protein n=1 Tax=Mycolicibacter icosiumassiliensis TaxID=1792835 RepID=UPI00082BB068|nr:hypothetical protein [Mycolicibacter icosiumassiliensis]
MSGETELAAAVDEWSDAVKMLGDELLYVVSIAPWVEIIANLVSLSINIAGSVGCFIAQGYLAAAEEGFAYREGATVASDACCGGAAALELDFDPVTELLVPMVNGLTWLTNAITGFVIMFGPNFVDELPNSIDIASNFFENLCDI